jgi:glycosyltransferase involved in cell wall biosynthesis
MELSVIIPAFNEGKALPFCLEEIDNVLQPLGIDFEIIVVDDGSTDQTWTIVKNQAAAPESSGKIQGVRFSRNFGKEAAIMAGLRASHGKAVCVLDADMQHPPAVIPEMLSQWRKGFLIVEGVKEERPEESCIRRWGAYYFYKLFTRLTRLNLQQSTDFKLLDQCVVKHYLALSERIRFFRGLTTWLGYPIATVSFSPGHRPFEEHGSRWSFGQLIDLARNSLIAFTSLPLRLVTWLGFFSLLVSLILGMQTLWNKLNGDAVEGFTTVILLQLLVGSVLMISLGLIGEYLARVYDEIKQRPMYIVLEETENTIQKINVEADLGN